MICFNLAILTADSCIELSFLCLSKDPSISRHISRRRTTGNISGIYFREVPQTMVYRRTDGSLANHLRVDFWDGNKQKIDYRRLWKFQKLIFYLRISACCLLACSNLMSKSCGLLRDELTLFIPPMSPFSMRCSYVCLSLIDPLRTLLLIDLFS